MARMLGLQTKDAEVTLPLMSEEGERLSFEQVAEAAAALVGGDRPSVALRYVDSDGDEVTIASDADLKEAEGYMADEKIERLAVTVAPSKTTRGRVHVNGLVSAMSKLSARLDSLKSKSKKEASVANALNLLIASLESMDVAEEAEELAVIKTDLLTLLNDEEFRGVVEELSASDEFKDLATGVVTAVYQEKHADLETMATERLDEMLAFAQRLLERCPTMKSTMIRVAKACMTGIVRLNDDALARDDDAASSVSSSSSSSSSSSNSSSSSSDSDSDDDDGKKKKTKSKKSESSTDGPIHFGVVCDGCNMTPLAGVRYKSLEVHDFDLCETCEASGKWASHEPFIKITDPSRAPKHKRPTTMVHPFVTCDGCEMTPIIGPRFKSTSVDDFDLCESCEGSGAWNETHGPFTKIEEPGMLRGWKMMCRRSEDESKWAKKMGKCEKKWAKHEKKMWKKWTKHHHHKHPHFHRGPSHHFHGPPPPPIPAFGPPPAPFGMPVNRFGPAHGPHFGIPRGPPPHCHGPPFWSHNGGRNESNAGASKAEGEATNGVADEEPFSGNFGGWFGGHGGVCVNGGFSGRGGFGGRGGFCGRGGFHGHHGFHGHRGHHGHHGSDSPHGHDGPHHGPHSHHGRHLDKTSSEGEPNESSRHGRHCTGRRGGRRGCNMFRDAQDEPDLEVRFVEDVSIEDGTVVEPGATLCKMWKLENSGDRQWPDGCSMLVQNGHPELTAQAKAGGISLPALQPGESFIAGIDLVAPSAPGRYSSFWRVCDPDGRNFGHRFWVDITVAAPSTSSTPAAPEAVIVDASIAETASTGSLDSDMEMVEATDADEAHGVEVVDGFEVAAAPKDAQEAAQATTTPFEEAMNVLSSMGFRDVEANRQALEAFGGSVADAINKLLSE